MPDYYSILGVSRTASKDEIRKAYRQLAMRWHPDKNPSAEAKQKFIQINNAYEALIEGKRHYVYRSPVAKRTSSVRPKTAKEMDYEHREKTRERMKQHADEVHNAFINLRNSFQLSRDSQKKKKKLEDALLFDWIIVAVIAVVCISILIAVPKVFPLIFMSSIYMGIPLAKGMAKKRKRFQMIFGPIENYPTHELEDFLQELKEDGF